MAWNKNAVKKIKAAKSLKDLVIRIGWQNNDRSIRSNLMKIKMKAYRYNGII